MYSVHKGIYCLELLCNVYSVKLLANMCDSDLKGKQTNVESAVLVPVLFCQFAVFAQRMKPK